MKAIFINETIVFTSLMFAFCFSDKIYSQEKLYNESKIRELHRKYMEASINHDIRTLKSLTHEDIIWYLGTDTLNGKEEAIPPHEYDAGYETILKYSNVVVKGDTVRFELLETNEQLKFFGMEGIRFYPQFIFKSGLVYRKMSWKRSPDIPEFVRRNKHFLKWIKTNHPDAIRTIRRPNGDFNFSFETGQLLHHLFKQWREENGEIYQSIKLKNKIAAKALKDGDVEAYVNLFTEDGIYMWPGIPAIEGRKALYAWFTKRFSIFSPEIEKTIEEIVVRSDWAIERGKEVIKIKNRSTGKEQIINGKYINLLHKQKDGSWKIGRRIRNLDHPPSVE